MNIFSLLKNNFNAAIGKQQEFDELLKAKDVTRALALMNDRSKEVEAAIMEYNVETHEIMSRPMKKIKNKNGDVLREEPQWKLPIPYPAYINEIALVMLYGRPLKWKQKSDNTDNVFQKFLDLVDETHFNSRMRECKRLAGKETESALLFHYYKDKENKPRVLLRVLAKSKGDHIRVMFDQYKRMTAASWSYLTREDGRTVEHSVIYKDDIIYRCKKVSLGWEVTEDENLLGKIPLIYFPQEKEHKGVERLIHREEHLASTDADVNDYFASPAVVADADVINNLPEKQEVGKVYLLKGEKKEIRYLTWDAASEAKENEKKWLQQHILSKTFTPKIDWETMSGLSNMSGKALEQLFLPAFIKAEKNKEVYGELMKRVASLYIACIANVLDISLAEECKRTSIGHEFQKPFADDVAEIIKNLIDSYDAGGMSLESFVEQNPLIEDSTQELKRIKAEAQEKEEKIRKVNMFEGAEV